MWLLKLLAELNHRRWFSATDINTDLGGAGACQLAARLRQGRAIRLWFGVRMATTSRRFGNEGWCIGGRSMSEMAIYQHV